jgi:type I restriction enzyme S subunit
LPNTLPSGWVLSNINEISLETAKNVRDGYLDLENTDYVSKETAVKCWNRCEPMHDDILMVCVGATTGRLCLLKKPPKFVIVRSVALVRPFPDYIYPEYLATVMKSPIVQSQVWKNVKQSAQPCLYINRINIINIPIPPFAEQRRIVARVDQLMSLCDELEAGLMRSQADSERLLEAVVGRMLAGGDGQEQAAEEMKNNIAILNDKT